VQFKQEDPVLKVPLIVHENIQEELCVLLEKSPFEHKKQELLADELENLPSGQVVHEVDPDEFENVPMGQSTQSIASA
jgi:hypothetical protein